MKYSPGFLVQQVADSPSSNNTIDNTVNNISNNTANYMNELNHFNNSNNYMNNSNSEINTMANPIVNILVYQSREYHEAPIRFPLISMDAARRIDHLQIGHTIDIRDYSDGNQMVVSRMRVEPLAENEMIPPIAFFEKIKNAFTLTSYHD
jgi:hypothetical protein